MSYSEQLNGAGGLNGGVGSMGVGLNKDGGSTGMGLNGIWAQLGWGSTVIGIILMHSHNTVDCLMFQLIVRR